MALLFLVLLGSDEGIKQKAGGGSTMNTHERAGSGREVTEGDLARRVRRRRGALGLSQDEVARRAGLDPDYLDRVEHAPAILTAGALIRLADALDTTVSELLGSQPRQPSGHGGAALHPVVDEMPEQECRQLIEPGGVGRVAFELAGRLSVVPVNFAMHDGAVVFRTAATTAMGRYGAGPVVFEVDRIDEGMHEGWSVVITGTARIADPAEAKRLRAGLSVEPWAGGDRDTYIVIEPEQVSGRRIRAW
jgi:transcriptional regulator with XRE-family HTH domain